MAQKKRSKRRSRLLILPFTKRNIYDQTRELGGAFEHNFGPKGREYERTILQKFICFEGGGEGMLKLRIDRCIMDKKLNATCLNLLVYKCLVVRFAL